MAGGQRDLVSSEPALGVKAELDAIKSRFVQERLEARNGRSCTKNFGQRRNVIRNSGVEKRDLKEKDQHNSYNTSDWVKNLKRKQKLYEQHLAGKLETDEFGEGVGGLLATRSHSPSHDSTRGSSSEQSDEDEADDDKVEITDTFGRSRLVSASQARQLGIVLNNGKEMIESEPERLIYGDVIQTQAFQVNQFEPDHKASQQVESYFDASKESRDLGAGFYHFSHDKSERQSQMADLKAARDSSNKESELFAAQFHRRQARIAKRWECIEQMEK